MVRIDDEIFRWYAMSHWIRGIVLIKLAKIISVFLNLNHVQISWETETIQLWM